MLYSQAKHERLKENLTYIDFIAGLILMLWAVEIGPPESAQQPSAEPVSAPNVANLEKPQNWSPIRKYHQKVGR